MCVFAGSGAAQAAAILVDQGATDLLEWDGPERLPVEVVHGALDAKRPVADAEAWRQVFPAAGLAVLADCGHTPPQERPDAVAAALGRLVRRVRATSG